MNIITEELAGKVVLEVGSGRGGTTRKLVEVLSGQPGACLIVTDKSDAHFQRLREAFQEEPVPIRFVCTEAQELAGIDNGSVDYLVCNYTLCAINAQVGQGVLALQRFREVLKTGGRLFVEEEFPINLVETSGQVIWAEKWRILKSATLLAGGFPYTEFAPETLADLCRVVGFRGVEWSGASEVYEGVEGLGFFEQRLEKLLAQLPNDSLRVSFERQAALVRQQLEQVGWMEVPFYRLTAQS